MASDVRLKEQLPRLTERIVAGYKNAESIHYLGHCPLPNYQEIVGCLEDLKEILYPGYRRREGLHIGNVTYHVGDLIDGLHDYPSVLRDFTHFESHLVDGGLALFHDYADYFPGVPAFVDELSASGRYQTIARARSLIALRKLPTASRPSHASTPLH